MAAAALAALTVHQVRARRASRACACNGALFMREARAAGLDTGNSIGLGILPVMVGTSLKVGKAMTAAVRARHQCLADLLAGRADQCRAARYFVTSEHTADEIRTTVRATKEALDLF